PTPSDSPFGEVHLLPTLHELRRASLKRLNRFSLQPGRPQSGGMSVSYVKYIIAPLFRIIDIMGNKPAILYLIERQKAGAANPANRTSKARLRRLRRCRCLRRRRIRNLRATYASKRPVASRSRSYRRV